MKLSTLKQRIRKLGIARHSAKSNCCALPLRLIPNSSLFLHTLRSTAWRVPAALRYRAALHFHLAQFHSPFSCLTLFLRAAKRAGYRKYGTGTLAA
jgi:hypothetical protein